jgi:hypothetical protein
MEAQLKWSLLGQRPAKPRPNVIALVVAFLLGFETFVAVTDGYPMYMSFLAIGASVWAMVMGIQAKSLRFVFVFTSVTDLAEPFAWRRLVQRGWSYFVLISLGPCDAFRSFWIHLSGH